jgi:NADPH-dependent 2,4-dienoyl-CoA reductase/sulfur reductase-like enzyme
VLSSTGPPADERTDEEPPCSPARHRVVIVGGGFGGLEAAKGLAGAPVDITLIDQRNYHLFQPLLYQVATASLPTSEIAWPIRALFRGRPEVRTLLAKLVGVDTGNRTQHTNPPHISRLRRTSTKMLLGRGSCPQSPLDRELCWNYSGLRWDFGGRTKVSRAR